MCFKECIKSLKEEQGFAESEFPVFNSSYK